MINIAGKFIGIIYVFFLIIIIVFSESQKQRLWKINADDSGINSMQISWDDLPCSSG